MDPQVEAGLALLFSSGAILLACIGVTEAFKQMGMDTKFAPIVSIIVGLFIAIGYIFMPSDYRHLYVIALLGATGTGTYAVVTTNQEAK